MKIRETRKYFATPRGEATYIEVAVKCCGTWLEVNGPKEPKCAACGSAYRCNGERE
jgi:hypothetical protein